MSQKKHPGGPAPVPPANQPKMGPATPVGGADGTVGGRQVDHEGVGGSEQDPQRRLGNFEQAGEHSIQQPGGRSGKND